MREIAPFRLGTGERRECSMRNLLTVVGDGTAEPWSGTAPRGRFSTPL